MTASGSPGRGFDGAPPYRGGPDQVQDVDIDLKLLDDRKVFFRDSGIFIQSSADGKLKLSADGTGTDDIILSGKVSVEDDLLMAASKKISVDAGFLEVGSNKLFNVATVSAVIAGIGAAVATNYGVFFIAPVACTVTRVDEVHRTAGTDAGAVNLQLERLQGVEAKDGGDALLTNNTNAGFSLKGTAETVQNGTLVGTSAVNLSVGDRLGADDDGTLTAVEHVCMTVSLKVT